MAVTFLDPLKDLGFQHLLDPELSRYFNVGLQHVCRSQLWPFLEFSETLPGPVITLTKQLRAVKRVTGPYGELRYLYRYDGRNAADVGTARAFLLAGGTQLVTWPRDASSFTIDYWQRHPAIAADVDPILVPADFLHVVHDAAAMEASKVARDWDGVAGFRSLVSDGLAEMLEALIDAQHVNGDYIVTWD